MNKPEIEKNVMLNCTHIRTLVDVMKVPHTLVMEAENEKKSGTKRHAI